MGMFQEPTVARCLDEIGELSLALEVSCCAGGGEGAMGGGG